MMYEKKGLIIQGPIISKGRTGKTANITFSKLKPKDIVEYDCSQNIINIFNTYQDLFDYIVFVTWNNQDEELINKLKRSIPSDSLVLIDDTTKPISPKGTLIPGNNKYRLFLSVYEGAKVLADLNCEIVIKIRSDQFLDLELLLSDAIRKLKKEERSVILVPWMNISDRYNVFEIPDHYFAAKTQDMLRFTYEYLTYPEFFDHIHTDIFFKWSLRGLSRFVFLRWYVKITLRVGNNIFLRILINPIISRGFFKPMDSRILDSVYWRGEKFKIDHIKLSDKEIIYSKTQEIDLKGILKKVYRKLNKKYF